MTEAFVIEPNLNHSDEMSPRMTETPLATARVGAVRAVKPRAVRARTAKMLVPAIAALAVSGIALVAVAQQGAPVQEASSVPSVDAIAQAQAQGYSAALVAGEAPATDDAATGAIIDRSGDAGSVTVATPEPEPTPTPSETAGSTGSGSSGSSSGGSSSGQSSAPKADYAPGTLQEMAANILAARGYGDNEFSCFSFIVNKESTWNPYAQNSSSGAYGLMQALPGSKMASHGSDWATNPETQIRWGLDYMTGRYGSPCGAYNFWVNNHWY